MKRVNKIIAGVVLTGMAIYIFRQPFETRLIPQINRAIANLRATFYPCSAPITYKLDTFDTQFGISKKYFLNALTDAEAIWEKPIGKNLFEYEPVAGNLKIKLIYDYRQEATTKLAGLGIAVGDDKASYEVLQAKYDGLKVEYSTVRAEYLSRLQIFNDRQTAYEQQVSYWNKNGGAPRNEYEKLQAEKSALQAEPEVLKVLLVRANELVDEINALVVALNRLVDSLNLTVEKYNTIGASRGETFEEGLYRSSSLGQEIDIFEFSSREKLVRVLAHELGHALGLEHLDDPKAIMYELNQGNTESLSKADITALKTKCGIKN